MLCFFSSKTQAQSVVGVKAGVNVSNFWINQSSRLESSMKAGALLGYFYKYRIREGVAIEADMMFHYLASEIKDLNTGHKADYRYVGMEMPVYGIIQVELENSTVYLGFGPFASVGYLSRYEAGNRNIDPYKKNKISDKAMMRRWDFGVGFMVGYELGFGLQFSVNYQLGFRNMLSDGSDKTTMNLQMFGAGVGYRF